MASALRRHLRDAAAPEPAGDGQADALSEGLPAPPSSGAQTPPAALYHEMRAPIALIATIARAAEARCDDEDVAGYLQRIDRIATQVLSTADEVLRLLGVASADAPPGELQLGPALDDAVAEWRTALPLSLELDPMAARAVVIADAGKLAALLSCVLSNAQRHGKADAEVRLSLSMAGPPTRARLWIANEVGEQDASGLGLGSWLIRQFVDALGWQLSVEDAAGAYRVAFDIPVVRLAASDAA